MRSMTHLHEESGQVTETRAARVGRWAILAIGTSFFLAELGDKTMLATITLATNQEPVGTWLGWTRPAPLTCVRIEFVSCTVPSENSARASLRVS